MLAWSRRQQPINPRTVGSLHRLPLMDYVRSKQRVADHGEVFTPPHLVGAMLDLVGAEADRIDSRFLEPACGSGNFLVPVLQRKLATVQVRYGKSDFECRHQALLALMSIYGIELLADNVTECRRNLLEVFAAELSLESNDDLGRAAAVVVAVNVVHGDALTMQTKTEPAAPITFAEWSYLGKGQYRRRDFRFDVLTQMSSFGEDTLFGDVAKHDIFAPLREHGVLTMADIAKGD